jgi:mRNA interferase RelE/StbE
MYKVELRRRAQRSLDRLPQKDFEAIVNALRDLAKSPGPKGVEKIKTAGLWRIRRGDYRVVFSIDDGEKVVTVLRIGHRREIYRAL